MPSHSRDNPICFGFNGKGKNTQHCICQRPTAVKPFYIIRYLHGKGSAQGLNFKYIWVTRFSAVRSLLSLTGRYAGETPAPLTLSPELCPCSHPPAGDGPSPGLRGAPASAGPACPRRVLAPSLKRARRRPRPPESKGPAPPAAASRRKSRSLLRSNRLRPSPPRRAPAAGRCAPTEPHPPPAGTLGRARGTGNLAPGALALPAASRQPAAPSLPSRSAPQRAPT